MPSQEEGNHGVSGIYVCGWWCYFQTEGEVCIHEHYFASLQSPNFCFFPSGKMTFSNSSCWWFSWKSHKTGERGSYLQHSQGGMHLVKICWQWCILKIFSMNRSQSPEDLIDRRKNLILALSHSEPRKWRWQEGKWERREWGKWIRLCKETSRGISGELSTNTLNQRLLNQERILQTSQ